jgi:hypothetical protein
MSVLSGSRTPFKQGRVHLAELVSEEARGDSTERRWLRPRATTPVGSGHEDEHWCSGRRHVRLADSGRQGTTADSGAVNLARAAAAPGLHQSLNGASVISITLLEETPVRQCDAELLIREARSRQRRRRRRSALVVVAIALVAIGVGFAVASQVKSSPHNSSSSTARDSSNPASGVIEPQAPVALAVGPGGTLYLLDMGREEILRYTPKSGFRVVAGDGHSGWSTDGTPATRARLAFNWYSGLAVTAQGAIYFTEDGRVREIEPDGALATVAGGGKVALERRSVLARQTDLTDVAGLTTGPGGELYVGTSAGVYRLADGVLHWVVGDGWLQPEFSAHSCGYECNPASQLDFGSATHLVFDGRGDLFVAGGGTWGVYERTVTCQLRFIENLRAQGGFWSSLAAAPNGMVVTASGQGLQWVGPDGKARPLRAKWPRVHGPHHVAFYPAFGVGVAVGPQGQIYVDSDPGDTFPNQGLLEVLPTGRVVWLWSAPA